MRARPPAVGQRAPRHVKPHWIDDITRIITIAAIGFTVLIAALSQPATVSTPSVSNITTATTHVGAH